MNRKHPIHVTRRGFLQTLFAAPIAYLLAACGLRPAASPTPAASGTDVPSNVNEATPTAQPNVPTVQPTAPASTPAVQVLAPTPACGDDDDVTPPQTEGPFYTPDTPERSSLIEPGLTGTKIVLTGYVLSTGCRPVAHALIDFWHADDAGVYDNVGYKLRGHQFTDDQGRYSLESIVPGLYPGRTRHFHVKVQAANQPVLTTQLYFPNEPGNATDGIFNPDLIMDVQDTADGKSATFNFVLEGV